MKAEIDAIRARYRKVKKKRLMLNEYHAALLKDVLNEIPEILDALGELVEMVDGLKQAVMSLGGDYCNTCLHAYHGDIEQCGGCMNGEHWEFDPDYRENIKIEAKRRREDDN